MNSESKLLNQASIMNFLDVCYNKCLDGVATEQSVDEMASEYLGKYRSPEKACKAMMRNQMIKCTASGVITGVGGAVAMPVTVTADVSFVTYVQLRMVACISCIAGYDLRSDQTRTFVYACLAGVGVSKFVKQSGVLFGKQLAGAMIRKVPGRSIRKINKKVGFKLLTKYGQKGLINMGKLIPVVGAVTSGGLDLLETRIIAERAYKWFIKGDFSDTENETKAIMKVNI